MPLVGNSTAPGGRKACPSHTAAFRNCAAFCRQSRTCPYAQGLSQRKPRQLPCQAKDQRNQKKSFSFLLLFFAAKAAAMTKNQRKNEKKKEQRKSGATEPKPEQPKPSPSAAPDVGSVTAGMQQLSTNFLAMAVLCGIHA
eukprot:1159274-Pelagomonas_calceolata.AAC.4